MVMDISGSRANSCSTPFVLIWEHADSFRVVISVHVMYCRQC